MKKKKFISHFKYQNLYRILIEVMVTFYLNRFINKIGTIFYWRSYFLPLFSHPTAGNGKKDIINYENLVFKDRINILGPN